MNVKFPNNVSEKMVTFENFEEGYDVLAPSSKGVGHPTISQNGNWMITVGCNCWSEKLKGFGEKLFLIN
jgi:hypothetical protein